MKVFISWSGQLSKNVATIVREFFPKVLQTLEVFMSDTDIEAGTRWFSEIESQLADTDYGIIVTTRENQNKAWLNFEAGALANQIHKPRVVPLLVDLQNTDLSGPLKQFQTISLSRNDMKKVLSAIDQLREEKILSRDFDETFDVWWGKFEERFEVARKSVSASPPVARTDRELLESVLTEVRGVSHQLETVAMNQVVFKGILSPVTGGPDETPGKFGFGGATAGYSGYTGATGGLFDPRVAHLASAMAHRGLTVRPPLASTQQSNNSDEAKNE